MFCWVVAITLSGLEPLHIAFVCCFIFLLLHIISHSFSTCKQGFYCAITFFHSFPTCTFCFLYLHMVHFGELGQFSKVQYSHNLGKCSQTVTNMCICWQICVFIDKYVFLSTNMCVYPHIFANIEERQKRCPLTISALLQFLPPLVRLTPARAS